jgi:hypothetical protein
LKSRVNTPVLLIAHRRPRETGRLVRAILSVRPERVYLATDGPRPDVPSDADQCVKVRELLRTADWPGDVEYLIQKENLGPRMMVPAAVDWALSQSERLIILEDDCLPHGTFFRYCDELLERYQNEPQVMMISGTNPAPWRRGPRYRFSAYGTMWGWATWASAWQSFWHARELIYDQALDLHALAQRVWRDPAEQRFWAAMYERLRLGHTAGWDYEWTLARLLRNGLSAMPRRNLVTNIGFGGSATNTFSGYSHPIGPLRRRRMRFPLVEPDHVEPDLRLDAVLRAGHLELPVPGLRGRTRHFLARVRDKVALTLKRNAVSH